MALVRGGWRLGVGTGLGACPGGLGKPAGLGLGLVDWSVGARAGQARAFGFEFSASAPRPKAKTCATRNQGSKHRRFFLKTIMFCWWGGCFLDALQTARAELASERHLTTKTDGRHARGSTDFQKVATRGNAKTLTCNMSRSKGAPSTFNCLNWLFPQCFNRADALGDRLKDCKLVAFRVRAHMASDSRFQQKNTLALIQLEPSPIELEGNSTQVLFGVTMRKFAMCRKGWGLRKIS